MASSDKTAKAVFKVHAARGFKVRRVPNKESKVAFDDLGKERSSTSDATPADSSASRCSRRTLTLP